MKYLRVKGGAGSGNFGHSGRPGEVGGSGSGGGESDPKNVDKAAALAKQYFEGKPHSGVDRTKWDHVQAVAAKFDDPILKQIAYLHDVLEDTPHTHEQLVKDFGKRVADAVKADTWDKKSESYQAYIARLSESSDGSKIKLADLEDNMGAKERGAKEPVRAFEYIQAVSVLRAAENAREGKVGTPDAKSVIGGLKGEHSVNAHIALDGKLTPERVALHDAIVAKALANAVPAPDGVKTFVIMGGGPASGKSTMLKSGLVTLPPSHVLVDADAIKKQLPEYVVGVEKGDKGTAMRVHEESSMIAARLQRESYSKGYNVVLDGTGDTTVAKLSGKIESARANGYRVVGVYATVPTDMAIERANTRATTGSDKGRFLNEAVVRESHASVSSVFPQMGNIYDHSELYDTSSKTPTLIASSDKGSGFRVLDPTGWQAFQDKAKK